MAAPAHASGGPSQDADRAARDATRAQDRAARDALDAERRAARDQADAQAKGADRAARIEQRFAEDRAKAAADAVRDPAKGARDAAKAEADRQKSLDQLASSGSGGNSGSGSGSSGSSGSSGRGPSGGSDSGSNASGSNATGSSTSATETASPTAPASTAGSAMREVAKEEHPDFDPRGFPVRKGEIVALDLGERGLRQAQQAGFRLIARDRLAALEGSVTRLETPAGLAPEAALAKLRAIDGNAVFDYTHYYGLQFTPQGGASPQSGPPPVLPQRSGALRLGMIDTAVAQHAALARTAMEQRRFGPGGSSAAAGLALTQHGTAVASILASEGTRRLLVADVFRGSATAPFTSADAIARALEWMSEARVPVVNISLAGPRNAILDRLIERASAQGMIVVAAAGNGGPTAPPAYPAALAPVVAVTAVDARSHVYRYANQGDYIAFAARGVDEPAAAVAGGIARYSGTSFATPHIAAWLARCRAGKGATAQSCRQQLRNAARDVGAPGRDPVYGWGVVDPG